MSPNDMLSDEFLTWQVQRVTTQVRTPSFRDNLFLLSGGSWRNRTEVLRAVAQEIDFGYVSVSLPLARALQDFPLRQRPLVVEDSLRRLMASSEDHKWKGYALDRIEVLFQPDLMTGVVSLLERMSKESPLLVAWPGKIDQRHIIYAYPGHPEHQSHRLGAIPYLSLED